MSMLARSRLVGSPCRERGQAVVEFIVAIGVFGTLLLGIFQMALLYRAKTTVDYAAFMAARDGSMHGATQQSVNDGLVKGLAPLYATTADAIGLGKAVALAKEAQLQGLAKATIVSPTKAMFKQVAVKQFDGVMAIPNDDLAYRSDAVRAANLLKVKVTYDYPLIVPVVDAIIAKAAGGTKQPILHADGKVRMMWVLPIQAQAIVNMQSPIRDANALASNNGGGNSGNGSGGNTGNGGGNPNPPGGGTNPPDGGGSPPGGGGIPPPPTPPFACPAT